MAAYKSTPINGGGPVPPCQQNCQGRSPTCHAECKEYLDFVEKRAAFREQRFRENDISYTVGKRYTAAFFDRKAKLKRDGRQIDK